MLIALVLSTGGLVAIGFAAAAPVGSITSGYDSALDGLDGVATFFGKVGNTLEGVEQSFFGLNENVGDLADALLLTGTPAGISLSDQIRSNVAPAITTAADAMDGVGSVFQSVVTPINAAVRDLRQPVIVDQYVNQVPVAAAVVFGTFSLILLLTLAPIWVCKVAHCPSTSLVFVFGALIWLVAAVVLAAGIVLSDFCVNPVDSLSGIATQGDTGAALLDTVTYFTSCDETTTPPGVLSIVTTSLNEVSAISDQLNPLSSAIKEEFSSDVNIISLNDAVSSSVNASVAAVVAAASSFTCRPVKTLYVDIVDPFCNTMIGAGILPYLALQFAVGAVLVISLFFNLAACYRHPSAKSDAERDADHRDGEDVTNPLPANVGAAGGLVYGEPLVKEAPAAKEIVTY
jgi:hypothetical protein